MTKLYYLALILIVLCGCTADYIDSDIDPQTPITVNISVCPSAANILSRSTDENGIKDVNVFLCGTNNNLIYHHYSTNASADLSVLSGEYTLFAIANLHKDVGELSFSEISTYKIPAETLENGKDLVMSAKKEVSIFPQGNSSTVWLPKIELIRNIAKVGYSISVDPSVDNITLLSVETINVPTRSAIFNDNAICSTDPRDYTSSHTVKITNNKCSRTMYMFENMQGTVSSILTQQQKSRANAPTHATHLHIRAKSDSKVIDYFVYLGENNTTDFNLRNNTSYTYNIVVKGVSTVDTRVESYQVGVVDIADIENGYVAFGSTTYCYIDVFSPSGVYDIRCKFEVLEGDASSFYINGDYLNIDGYEQPSNEEIEYQIEYLPSKITESNEKLKYSITISDNYGYSQSYIREYRYANFGMIYTKYYGVVSGKGSVAFSDDICNKFTQTRDYNYYNFSSKCDGITLNAIPDNGYAFAGWYKDKNFTKLLSSAAVFKYAPDMMRSELFPKFIAQPAIRLDLNGTANCYIATAKRTTYQFNGSYRGNNKATTNSPAYTNTMYTSARVLWQNGEPGYVIGSVKTWGNLVEFTTGDYFGNAVIGIFNDYGSLIWSWHIWFTDFDPNATALTYSGGRTFMDRNLGAINNNTGYPSLSGTYYQWGRKDPFNSESQCYATYAAGFEPQTVGIRDVSACTEFYGWTNPTHFIGAVEYDVYSHADWLVKSNANLWGNDSPKDKYVGTSQKSIYDPCPVGWKVPDPKAWSDAGFSTANATFQYGGFQMKYNGSANTTYYPLSGIFYNLGGYGRGGETAMYWSNSSYPTGMVYFSSDAVALEMTKTPKNVNAFARRDKAYGLHVRCIKE